MSACTIVSNNYLAHAVVFAESYKRHHPDADVFACVVDRPDPTIDYAGLPLRIVFAEELEIPAFENMAFRYNIVELNTAVKPFFLSYLRDRLGLGSVFYFDPDILVCNRLEGLEAALRSHDLVLTPHITEPLDNEYRPAERMMLQAGSYNLGFLGIRLGPETEPFLEWWKNRLYQFCQIDLAGGLFVDQKWMDLAPSFLDRVKIVRDPIYNIAYWNLAHRSLVESLSGYEVGGRPVGFFHFSGFDVDDPETISRHQNRIHFRDRPDLRPLFEQYRELLDRTGHRRLRTAPYGFGQFRHTRIPVPWLARHLLQRIDPRGHRWPEPFDETGDDSFLAWLLEPLEFGKGTLNRAVLGLWEERPDLIRAFPEPCDRDLERFVDWLIQFEEAARAGLHPFLYRGVRLRQGRPAPEPRARPIPSPYDVSVTDAAEEILTQVDLSHPGDLTHWLNEPSHGADDAPAMLTRLALLIHGARHDVRFAYPDPLGADRLAFALWFVNHGSAELELSRRLTRPVWRSLPLAVRVRHRLGRGLQAVNAGFSFRGSGRQATVPAVHDPAATLPAPLRSFAAPLDLETPPNEIDLPKSTVGHRQPITGVNLAGYFDHPSGVGQIGRGVRQALHHAKTQVAPISIDQMGAGRAVRGRLHAHDGAPFPVTLICANADQLPNAISQVPLGARLQCRRIGYWFWEMSHFPLELADRFEYLDELWAPSLFCYEAFRQLSSIPVRWVPPHAPPPTVQVGSKKQFGLDPDRFYFLFAFDTLSVPERKNPFAAIKAIGRLERELDRKVGLILKINRAERSPDLMGRLRKKAEGKPVHLVMRDSPRKEMDELIAASDAILSLHRSEGLGLLPIEGLYLSKPVVATGYGGVTDFFDEETGYPVRYALERLEQAHGPYPAGCVWAEPDVAHAVELMSQVVTDPEDAQRRARAGRQRVENLYGIDAAAARFVAELERLADRPRGPGPTSTLSLSAGGSPLRIDRFRAG